MAKKSKTATLDSWDRVYVFGGEAWQVRAGVSAAIEAAEASGVTRFNREASPKLIFESLTRYQFDDPAEAITLINPNADQLKACTEAIVAGRVTSSALIVYTPGDSLDGRSSFALNANKQKRVWTYSHIEAGDTHELRQHMKDWQDSTECKLDSASLDWLLKNAPTMSVKVKATGGKKDTEAYDLETLESELDKVLVVRDHENIKVTLNDLQQLCEFEQSSDIWSFIRHAVQGNGIEILKHLTQLDVSKTDQGALWLLASQLGLVISIKSLLESGCSDPDRIAQMATSESYVGKYFMPGWKEAEVKPVTPLNPWRVRKAIESIEGATSQQLSSRYGAVINAIRDLRIGLSPDVVVPYLTWALAGTADYSKPLDDRY